MEYFVVSDLGYDGMGILKYASKEKAEKRYNEEEAEGIPTLLLEDKILDSHNWQPDPLGIIL